MLESCAIWTHHHVQGVLGHIDADVFGRLGYAHPDLLLLASLSQRDPYLQMRAHGPGYGSGSKGVGAASRLYCGLLDPVPVGLPHPGHFRIASVATHLKHTSPKWCVH